MNHTRLESMFHKKHAPHIHAHKLRHAHAHHAHTHDFMYANVHTCTHCGCTCHLVKFYYDKVNPINFANKNVWVSNKTNPLGPKRKWVSKSPPLVFDVGVGSHKM